MAFIKFVIASLLTNLIGYSIFSILLLFGFEVYFSLASAYIMSFIISQLINSFVIFKKSKLKLLSFLINMSLYIILFYLNINMINFTTGEFKLNPLESQFMIMMFIIMTNYFLQKYIYSNKFKDVLS